MYGEGISKIGEIIDLGVNYEIIKKSGSWFSYGETKIGQGARCGKKPIARQPRIDGRVGTKNYGNAKSGKSLSCFLFPNLNCFNSLPLRIVFQSSLYLFVKL